MNNALTPEPLQAPPPPPMLEALSLDVQARASALQRAQLNNSALANNQQGAPGPLNNTAPMSAVAINQSALNNSALNAQNAALNNSALNRSALSGQPARQTVVLNTSAHNRSAFDNKMTNPIIRDASPIGPLTNQPPQYQSNLPGEQFPLAQRQLSGKLTIVFWLGVVLLLVEMFIMLGRYHFLSLLVGLAVIGLFALNMFSSYYNRCVLAALLVSIGFDIAWLVIKMHRGTEYPGFYSPFASLHTLVNMAVVMFIFLSIFLRVALFVLLLGFREVQPDRSYFIVVMGNELTLNGPPSIPAGSQERNYIVYHPV